MRKYLGYTYSLPRQNSCGVDINVCKLVIALLHVLTLNLNEFCPKTKKPWGDGPWRVILLFYGIMYWLSYRGEDWLVIYSLAKALFTKNIL